MERRPGAVPTNPWCKYKFLLGFCFHLRLDNYWKHRLIQPTVLARQMHYATWSLFLYFFMWLQHIDTIHLEDWLGCAGAWTPRNSLFFSFQQFSPLSKREMFYLTTHSTHFIYGYMASDIWLRTILIVRKETRCRHIGYSYRLQQGFFYMHHPTDRITQTTAFVTPVVEHWLEWEIAQCVHPKKDRSDDPSHHERTLYLWATSCSLPK